MFINIMLGIAAVLAGIAIYLIIMILFFDKDDNDDNTPKSGGGSGIGPQAANTAVIVATAASVTSII